MLFIAELFLNFDWDCIFLFLASEKMLKAWKEMEEKAEACKQVNKLKVLMVFDSEIVF